MKKGTRHSIKTKEKLREITKDRWSSGKMSREGCFKKGNIPPVVKNPDLIRRIQIKRKESWLLGKTKFTDKDYRKRMSLIRKGKHYSKDTEFKKGQTPHNKGKKKEDYEPQKRSSKKRERKDINHLSKTIVNLYINKNRSQFEIAKKLKCDFVVINRILKQNKIKIRPQSYYVRGKECSKKGKTYEEFFGKQKAERFKQKIREARKHQVFPLKDTTIEVKIQNFLSQLHIEFFTHKYISEITQAYQCDIFIPSTKTIIECDGCYWHGCQICNKKINEWQDKQIIKDNQRTSELEEKGFRVIRLWEHKIKKMDINKFCEILK